MHNNKNTIKYTKERLKIPLYFQTITTPACVNKQLFFLTLEKPQPKLCSRTRKIRLEAKIHYNFRKKIKPSENKFTTSKTTRKPNKRKP